MVKDLNKLVQFLLITSFGIYGVFLYLQDQLGLYIHPRYFGLSLVAAVVVLVTGVLGIFKVLRSKESAHQASSFRYGSFLQENWILIVIVFWFLVLTPATLSARTVAQRSSVSVLVDREDEKSLTVQNFIADTASYSLGDWVKLLNAREQSFFFGKEVKVEGFIAELTPDTKDKFLVAQYVVRCCVVDATPIGIGVDYKWSTEFQLNDWVEIEGVFDLIDGQLMIIPKNIALVTDPDRTYIY